MKTIFNYNTRTSFGLGSEHLSVEIEGDKININTGTPMDPVLKASLDYDKGTIEDIKDKMSYLSPVEVAIYIKSTYI